MRKIVSGTGFGSKIKQVDERPKTKTTMAMQCCVCENIFYTMNFGPQNSADACDCRNMRIGIARYSMIPSPGRSAFYLTLTVADRTNVKLYSVERETLEPVQPHKEY
jgi:hypothetical protein